ncbi:MAG: hypothetical protein HZA50_01425 [Planctomycetes bacterium]|nr:hypothetical protein [Planctomycetota bacterium]
MIKKRKRYDRNLPGTRELADSIVHGAAITEGTMVAFPTCFPGVTSPVAADESRITAMSIAPDGIVYAGTSGRAAHLLVGMFHGITGMVFDMGEAEGAVECTAVCCGRKTFVAAVNGPAGGQLVIRELQPLPFDLIQEWHVSRLPYRYVQVDAGRRILHAVANADRDTVIGVTEAGLFTYKIDGGKLDMIGEVPGAGRLARGPGGCIYGREKSAALWRFDAGSRRIDRKAVPLPQGDWSLPTLLWAQDETGEGLYTVDGAGKLFHFSHKGFSKALGVIPILPVGAMAVTRDGRLFASSGDGIARMFCYNPTSGKIADLGVAVSVMERRRYGYCFGDAVVGRDGEIIFGENDDMGHLWLYFPSILPAGKERK